MRAQVQSPRAGRAVQWGERARLAEREGAGGSVEPLRPTRESDWSSVPAEITARSPAPPTLPHPPIGSPLQKRVWPDFRLY